MNTRLKKITGLFSGLGIDALLVTKDENITYLTEFPASESWLLITPQKSFYITDFRYILEAEQGLKGIEVKEYKKTVFETLFQVVSKLGVKSLGFDDRYTSLFVYNKIKQAAPKGLKLHPVRDLVEDLRMIKSEKEIKQVRECLKLNLAAYKFIKRYVKPGVTEKDLLFKIENYVKSRGAGFSFDPIVASGPNSCLPHAKVTSRKLRNNEPVLIDMGIDIGGYKSDLTRMFFLGKIPQLVSEVNDFVAQAQEKAIAKIKAGIRASEVDDQARNFLSRKRLGKYFGHSLGHGVGLEIHEAPRISQASSVILKENMIFTVEPAVYIPNKFGVRIEDMVLVTKDGCEVLSR